MLKLSEKILALKNEGKSHKAISIMLKCAISTISFHCKKSGLGNSIKVSISENERQNFQRLYDEGKTIAEVSELVGRNRITVRRHIVKRATKSSTERKKGVAVAVSKRRRKVKEMAVEHKGGRCVKCGYANCIAALEFHHVDPSQKDFNLGNNGNTMSWEKIQKELEKCILVCSNCHREIHHEMRQNK